MNTKSTAYPLLYSPNQAALCMRSNVFLSGPLDPLNVGSIDVPETMAREQSSIMAKGTAAAPAARAHKVDAMRILWSRRLRQVDGKRAEDFRTGCVFGLIFVDPVFLDSW